MNYIDDITTALTWLGFFAAMFFSYYYYLKFRNQERMKLIEQNVDLSEFYKKKKNGQNFPWFILGFTILGLSIGSIIGLSVILYVEGLHVVGASPLFAFAFTFGALGLIIGRMLEKKKKK